MTTTSKQKTTTETKLRSFFGFKSLPFTKNLEAHTLLQTETHSQALDRLRYLIDRKGIGALFGAPGTGKSTVIRTFLSSLGRANHAVCYVSNSTCAALDLYRQIARGFALEPRFRKGDLMEDIKNRLLKLSRSQKLRPLLVIDDAHLLPSNFLDELRFLTNFDTDAKDDLTLILAGHPQLESNFRLAINEALAQRIVCRIRIRSLHPNEVQDYIDFRLEHAGRTAKIFLPDAIESIAKASRGIPRLVDRIAENCLLIALKTKRKDIDADLVMAAVEEVDP